MYNGSWQNGFLGYVDDLKLGGKLDAALVTIEGNSNFLPTSLTAEGDYVSSGTALSKGSGCYILGSESKGVRTKALNVSAEFSWSDPDSGEENVRYKDMIAMRYIDDTRTVGGDSGAPILKYWNDGEISLGGIYKVRKKIDGEIMAIGSHLENIQDYFGVDVYLYK